MFRVGSSIAISTPMAAFSRSTTPRRSRTWATPGFPAFTESTICLVFLHSGIVVEEDPPVNPLVGPFLLLDRPRADQPERPPLELIGVLFRQARGAVEINRLADHIVGVLDVLAEGVAQPVLDQGDGQVRDVDADPRRA